MLKTSLLALALALSPGLRAVSHESASDRLMKSNGGQNKIPSYDRQAVGRAIDETLGLLEDLSRQLMLAPKAEADAVWLSGDKDFNLSDKQVNDTRQACA